MFTGVPSEQFNEKHVFFVKKNMIIVHEIDYESRVDWWNFKLILIILQKVG